MSETETPEKPPKSPKPKKKKKKRSLLGVLGTALKRTCTLIGALVLFSAFMGAMATTAIMESSAPTLPDQFVLSLPLKGVTEYEGNTGYYPLAEKYPTVREIVDALDYARTDNRVKGFVTVMKSGGVNLAQIQEIRAAVHRFRESGKFAYIYAVSYGDMGRGLGTYYLASAFDEIWMQPVGMLSVAGIKAEVPFVRDVLNKIGVEPQFFARKEYKNVFESFSKTGMSDESREMTSSMIGDMALHIMDGISKDRAMSLPVLQTHVDKGIFVDREALEAKLVDRLDYLDVMESHVKKIVTGDPENPDFKFVKMKRYVRAMEAGKSEGVAEKPLVALVYIAGTIVMSDSGSGYGGNHAVADDIASDILGAANDEDIRAIVLRIDSPGGSPTASEAIRRAIVRAKEKGKTIIVSMGGAAASGGYWIAADADYIFALPGTLTGSIGVAGGKFVMQELWNKLGVNWESVQVGKNAGVWSLNEPFSEAGTERVNAMMDSIYAAFIHRVAEGRHMTPVQVDEVARGRVWTGRQAVGKGLVDGLGGLDMALDYVAGLVGAVNRDGLNVVILPKPQTPFEKIVELVETQVSMGAALNIQAALFRVMEPFADAANILSQKENVLTLETLDIH